MNTKKIITIGGIYVKLDAETKAALPTDPDINVSEWIREAIREKHARERTSEPVAAMCEQKERQK